MNIANIRDCVIIVAIAACAWIADNPEMVGHWQANRDIAYDSIMMEYVADCDCTESLE